MPPTGRNIYKGKPSKGKNTKFQGNKKNQFKPPNKKGRVVVRNLPFKVSEETIRKHFAQFGSIREVNLLKRPDGNPVGCGFIQFNEEDHAARAIESCSGKDFMGRTIKVDWALQQDFYIVARPTVDFDDDGNVEEKSTEQEETKTEENVDDVSILDNSRSSDNVVQVKKKKPKRDKTLNKAKKGRVIVRNLPFKVTEDSLRKHFSEYGGLSEVTILKKPNGQMVGCGFVQFTVKKNAAKAIIECSGKPLLGRPIVLDWAVQKTLYKAKNAADVEVKIEPKEEVDESDTKPVKFDSDVKSENESDGEGREESDEEEDGESDDEEGGENDDEEMEDDEEEKVEKRPRVSSNDVSEGKTVFLKNVPYSATNQDLRERMELFGPVFYALICFDRLTEHSRGTAFVKFTTTESAQQCLCAGTELTLHGQVLDPHPALDRNQVNNKSADKAGSKTASKDNRNLFLVKEGVILAGSPSAAGVSVTDMAKRLQLEQWKTQMLRNLNMFVARDRLAVHNLPPAYDDTRLRELFQSHAGADAVIKEARVMRDMRNVDLKGVGKSKETGFVKFSTHEDALRALRKINNNPNIFSKAKRPIVAFSIENRAIHKVRQQREQKSRAKNPTFVNRSEDPLKKKTFSKAETRREKRNKQHAAVTQPAAKEGFGGVAAEPGKVRLRSKFNLRTQATLHAQAVRKDKNKVKSSRKVTQQKQIREEHIRQPRQKQGKRKGFSEEQSFSKLVSKYVSKISTTPNKWYDG